MSNAALERRLGPVYDAIDSRNYKAALKHSEAALKKHPGNQLLLALRAFSLERTGRAAEALAVLQSIVEQGPESERVLHTMSFTYRAAGRADAVAAAYAVAHERNPHDLDILVGLFGAYAKELNFVKQQQIALKLSKAHPEGADRYGWWAVASLALQARAAAGEAGIDDPKALQMAKLAETMAARQISRQGGVPSYEALLLYTDILLGQGKASEAAEAVRTASKAGSATGGLAADSRQLLAAALARSGNLAAAAALYRAACLEDPNDWWSWHLHLNCVLPGSAQGPGEPLTSRAAFPVGVAGGLAEAWDKRNLDGVWAAAAEKQAGAMEAAVEEARATLAALLAAAGGDKGDGTCRRPSRGAALAPLELACRLQRLGLAAPRALAAAVAAALPALCSAFCCAVDLRRYISQLQTAEDMAWLAARVAEICEEQATAAEAAAVGADADDAARSKAAVKALWCRVNSHALREELGAAPPGAGSSDGDVATAAAAYATQLVALHSSNLQLSEGLDSKERGHGEDAVALAAGALVTSARGAGPRRAGALLAAAALALEAAQVRRTVVAPLRLASTAVYSLLGAPASAAAQLTALDVKAVLHETMTGHWALPALLAGAATEIELANPWLHGIRALHVDQVLEASESIFTAYDEGAYSKIPEFVDFWEALGRSHTRWAGEAERSAAALRTAAAQGPAALRAAAAAAATTAPPSVPAAPQAPEIDALRFNEDLSTRPSYFPPEPTDLRLAVAAWWEGGSVRAVPAAPGVWWSVPTAGERDCPQAATWRDAQRNALARRRALPAALAGLMAPEPLDAEALEALRATVDGAWALELCRAADSDPGLVCAATGALLHAGIAVHAALAALKSGDGAAEVDAACTALHTAGDCLSAAFARTTALWAGEGASETGMPLPGNAGPALAAALLTEEGVWAGACLPQWAKLLKSAAVSDSNPAKIKLQEALAAAAAATHAGIAALDAAVVAARDAPSVAAAEGVLAELKGIREDIEGLWTYENDFDAVKALEELAKAQAATAGRLHVAAAKALSLLAPLLS